MENIDNKLKCTYYVVRNQNKPRRVDNDRFGTMDLFFLTGIARGFRLCPYGGNDIHSFCPSSGQDALGAHLLVSVRPSSP